MTKLAFVFPGQGSQAVGMMTELAHLPVVHQVYEEAADALGFDLWALTQTPENPADINQTINTQPAMLAAGVATLRSWQALGGATPSLFAGHSLGEWTALVATNVLNFADALKIVRLRGEQMQAAVPAGEGAMAAILGLDNEAIEALVAKTSTEQAVVVAANYNSPGQVVVSGSTAGVEEFMAAAKAAGAKRALPLPVSVPSHSPLMQPAVDAVHAALVAKANLTGNAASIISFNGEPYQDVADVLARLPQQLVQPIRWDRIAHTLAEQADWIVECGPGNVLTGLSKRILTGTTTQLSSINSEKTISNTIELMQSNINEERQHG